MTQPDLTALVHLVGFSTGIVLYAMLAVMTMRPHTDAQRLSLAAASLGLLWNVGALVIYALRDFGLAEPSAALMTISFSALGFLPAVVVHAAVGPPSTRGHRRALLGLAYALSAAGALMQVFAATRGELPSRAALLTLTAGYTLVIVLLAVSVRGGPYWQRNLSTAGLAAFAVSALHLSHDVAQADSWFVALVGHHASLPLVLVILYQDYRFAFADLFLRRALSLLVLVGIAMSLHVVLATPLMRGMQSTGDESLFATAAHVALWVGTALLYPLIRQGVGRFVDRMILNRASYQHVRDDVAFAIGRAGTPNEILERTCAVLGPVLGANVVTWRIDPDAVPSAHATLVLPRDTRDRAAVNVPTAEAPCYVIDVGALVAGRRLLSDDATLLESVAALAGRRIDALRVTQERFERDLREREILQLAAESELRALRAQLNPHFLFNALTTIGYLLRAAPERALGTLYRLTDLLRAVLRRPSGELVTLGEELEIIDAYLAIERERFEEKLHVHVDVPEELRTARIPPLLLQPLVENAVKHGISALTHGGSIFVSAYVNRQSARARNDNSELRIVIADTGAGFDSRAPSQQAEGGVGLSSVRRRLERHFGSSASFDVAAALGHGTTVTLAMPLVQYTQDFH
ncbi:MAG: sensor histidine kinase [Gemmatimonadaceae bacterium]